MKSRMGKWLHSILGYHPAVTESNNLPDFICGTGNLARCDELADRIADAGELFFVFGHDIALI